MNLLVTMSGIEYPSCPVGKYTYLRGDYCSESVFGCYLSFLAWTSEVVLKTISSPGHKSLIRIQNFEIRCPCSQYDVIVNGQSRHHLHQRSSRSTLPTKIFNLISLIAMGTTTTQHFWQHRHSVWQQFRFSLNCQSSTGNNLQSFSSQHRQDTLTTVHEDL